MKPFGDSLFSSRPPGAAGRELINSDIVFNYHLQGVAADETGIYWSFTDTLVKTDYNLKLLKKVTFENYHGGDLYAADGYIYWSMLIRNSKLIAANNNSRAAVWQFNRDLELVKKYTLPVKEGDRRHHLLQGEILHCSGIREGAAEKKRR